VLVVLAVAIAACSGGQAVSESSASPTTVAGTVASAPPTAEPPAPTTLATWPDPPEDLCSLYGEPRAEAVVSDARLDEVSGIASSRRHPGIVWMHNDSGDGAVVYAVDETGVTAAAFNLGVLTLDPEDLALGPGPATGDYLYLADIGDNFTFRPVVSVYRVAEPDPDGATMSEVERIDLVYPDGPADAEALAVDPVTGDLLVVTKAGRDPAVVWRAPAAGLVGGAAVDLVEVATLELDAEVTGADISVTGDRVALRGYDSIWLWRRTALDLGDVLDADPCRLDAPPERQGEAIAFGTAGNIITVSEGAAPSVYEVPRR
jgi:hypothetical protein